MTTYSEQDRDWHYLATVDKSDCPLCLLGMGSSHGQGRDEETRARLGDRWWAADRLEGAKHAAAVLVSDAQRVPFTAESMPAYDAAERATIAREMLASFHERTDELINDLGDAIEHEPCAFTLKASSGEIIDHLSTILELGPDCEEVKRCHRELEDAPWWDASIIIDGALDESKELYSEAEIDELVSTLDRLASDGKPTELYLLRHDHAPLGPDDEDVCVQYLTDHHPFKSWNVSADEEL